MIEICHFVLTTFLGDSVVVSFFSSPCWDSANTGSSKSFFIDETQSPWVFKVVGKNAAEGEYIILSLNKTNSYSTLNK